MIFFNKLTLRQKLIMTSIACLILPTVIMMYNTDEFSKRIIREHTLENSNQVMKNVQVQIDSIVEDMVRVSNMVQFDSELMSTLQGNIDPLAAKQVTGKIEQLTSGKPNMQATLLLMDGQNFTNYSYYDFDPLAFRQQPWFAKLADLSAFDTLFIGVQPNYLRTQAPDKPYVIMIARVLKDYSSRPFAYLIVSRTESTVSDIFRNFSEEFFLLDSNNRILAHKDKQVIGGNFQSLMQTTGSRADSPELIQLRGENYLYVSLPMRYGNWRLVSLAPYEQLTDKLYNIYRSGLLLQVGFVVGFIMILAYFLQKFTKPIRVLGDAAIKVEAGDLEVRSRVRGGDEVGRLGRAFDHMLDRIMQILDQVKIEQELKRQAEIAMLHAQIHPHFLFNILTSIRLRLLMKHDEENAELIGSLASLLRSTFSIRQEFVSLLVEVEVAKQYTDLMNFTVKHKAHLRTEISPELLMETVPRYILQPLIENAFKHGFVRKGGAITIRADRTEQGLLISVKDNGHGIEVSVRERLQAHLMREKPQIIKESAQKQGEHQIGIGLTNVYDRLKLIYGDGFRMTLHSEEEQGTEVTLTIPFAAMEEDGHVQSDYRG